MAKYLKQDSDLGYIVDSAQIEYLKLNNLRHSILGRMLGDFDEQGFYVVSAEIQKELLSMKKYIVNSLDNIEICHGEIALDQPITFFVTFENDRATLSLVEKMSYEANFKINSGTYSNVNEFILDEVETAGEIDRNLVYKRWNIHEFSGKILDIHNMDEETLALYSGLAERYRYLLSANKIMLEKEEQIEDVEAEYANKVLAMLKNYPKLKKAVDEEIKTDLTEKKKFIRLDRPNYAKTFNEVLDQALENNLSELDEKELKLFEEEKRAITINRNMQLQESMEVKTAPTLDEEVNIVELGEDIARTNVKLTLNAPIENKPLGELREEYLQKEKETFLKVAGVALGIAGAVLAKKAGSQREQLAKNINDSYTPVEQTLGEELASQLGQAKKDAAKAAKVEPVAPTAAPQKDAAQTKPKTASPATKKPAAKADKPKQAAPKAPASKETKKEASASTSTATYGGGGGMIGGRVRTPAKVQDVNFGKASNGRANATKTEHSKRQLVASDMQFDANLRDGDLRKYDSKLNSEQGLIAKANQNQTLDVSNRL